jgi:hypothetical protein
MQQRWHVSAPDVFVTYYISALKMATEKKIKDYEHERISFNSVLPFCGAAVESSPGNIRSRPRDGCTVR